MTMSLLYDLVLSGFTLWLLIWVLMKEKYLSNGYHNNKNSSSSNKDVNLVVTYVRHGNRGCPGNATLLYTGYTAGGNFDHHGGGSNYLCLPKEPEWPAGVTEGFQSEAFIYGTEYQSFKPTVIDARKHDNDVVCALCEVTGKVAMVMIPAKRNCPPGWDKEFDGVLVSQYHGHKKSADFTCVDLEMHTLEDGGANKDGALFYPVEAFCGSLPCPPYKNGYELACVVCTK